MDACVFRIPSAFHLPSTKSSFLTPNLFRSPRYYTYNHPFKLDSKRNDVSFDEAAYEAERLRLDAKARESMAMEAAEKHGIDNDGDPKAWKWVIWKRIWDLMEAKNIAQFPRPVHHRIPNIVGAPAAANKLSKLNGFPKADCVKVNPDTPQKQVRFLALNGGKKLLTPQPRLRTGFFSMLESNSLSPNTINEACTSVGVAKYGKPIGLDEKIKVYLIVIGSVAVDPKTGARLGKGEGFAELEYGMLRYMGAIDDSTPIVTSVHDEQLVDDIPVEKPLIHDVPVDIICTPTQVIFTNTSIGINFHLRNLGKLKSLENLKSKSKEKLVKNFPLALLRNFLPLLKDDKNDSFFIFTRE